MQKVSVVSLDAYINLPFAGVKRVNHCEFSGMSFRGWMDPDGPSV